MSLGTGRIGWTAEGSPAQASLGEIAAIHLLTGAQSMEGPVGSALCEIQFSSGRVLTVLSSDGSGRPDAAYRAFVERLHQQLGPGERARIRFVAGFGSARYWFLLTLISLFMVPMILGGVLALFLGGPSLRLFVAMFGCIGMTVGTLRLLHANAPHAYDPSNPIESAASGSISGTIAQALSDLRRAILARPIGALAVGAAVVAVVIFAIGAQGSANMFEPGRAEHAFDVIRAAYPQRVVTKVEVTPAGMLVEFPDPLNDSSARTEWRASRARLFGWSEWDRVSGPHVNYNVPVGDLAQPFEPQADDFIGLSELARAAIARAGLGAASSVAAMLLTKAPDYVRPEPPRWTVRISGPDRSAEVFADRHGALFPAMIAPAGPPRIVVRTVSDTWVRIVNPDRSIGLEGILRTGSHYDVPDVPGIVLQTGKAQGLEISVDGRAIPPIEGGFLARTEIVLEPDALLAGTAVRR
ncbi:MAG: DUF4115 domain-containing protein [Alphaproteobacteria bacterium]|nr:DUF4115 domain-containing protein [Alphaproteobacteria bacterium]